MTPAIEGTKAGGAPGARPGDWRRTAGWLLLGLFLGEFLLFDQWGARRFTNSYPRWNDQIQYLTESYAAFERARAEGLPAALWSTLINSSAQGTLHDFLALLAFTVAGPSRSAALALNLLALVAWQAALYWAVAHRGHRVLAGAAVFLPLALAGPWRPIPGSAFDFRLDHLAMCALGVSAALAWRTDGLRARRASLAFGLAVGLTLVTRFLTGTYFVLMLAFLLAWTLTQPDRRVRTANLGRAVCVAALVALPFFWRNWETARDYYWIGHYVGPESTIRDPHLTLAGSLSFVLREFFQRHVGWVFVGIAATGAVLLGWRRGSSRDADRTGFIWGATFLLAPAIVLTLHPQKSEVVLSALAPGLVTLVAASWLAIAGAPKVRQALPAMVAVALGAGLFFVHAQLTPLLTPADQTQNRTVNAVCDEIFRRAQAGKLTELRVAVDHITDAFDAQVLRIVCYERHRVWFPVNMTLPTGIAEPDGALVLSRLEESDFVFVTTEGPAGLYPYDRKLAALRPQVQAWCDAHLRLANQFDLFGRRLRLYQRREIPFP
jgi:hypothetical protein